MSAVNRFVLFILFLGLSGCRPAPITEGHISAPSESTATIVDQIVFPTQIPIEDYGPEQVSASHDAALTQVQSPAAAEENTTNRRPPVEQYVLVEKASSHGAPYDEEYSLQIESSIWEPFSAFEEEGWVIFKISTLKAPVCSLEIRLHKETAIDIQELLAAQNRYRRMGTFSISSVEFDIYSFTTDTNSLADTQHVDYIVNEINGDHPFLLKPQFHAFSAYNDWEKCRPLVRGVLSSLSMKRIPKTN